MYELVLTAVDGYEDRTQYEDGVKALCSTILTRNNDNAYIAGDLIDMETGEVVHSWVRK